MKFFRFCDNNPNVLEWGSENVVVPYKSPVDNRMHRYFVDNFIVIREGEQIKKYLVEIKPFKQTQLPTTKYKKRRHLLYEQKMYITNQAKWEAAKEYGKKKLETLDAILFTDPDSDRIGLVCKVPKHQQHILGKYRFVSGNELWTIILRFYLQN